MKLWTIWTLPLVSITVRWWYTRNEIASMIGGRLPKRIKYWIALNSFVDAMHELGTDPNKTTVQELMDWYAVSWSPYTQEEEQAMADEKLTPAQQAEIDEKVEQLRAQTEKAVTGGLIDWNKDEEDEKK